MEGHRFPKVIFRSMVLGVMMICSLHIAPWGEATKALATPLPRTIVTTDGEIDDMDSFLRFLLYTDEMDVEGLIYSSSQWHYKGDGKGTKFISAMPLTRKLYGERTELRWCGTEWMQKFIAKYREVYPNLLQHDGHYPSPDKLLSLVKIGNIDFEGEMSRDTDGSNRIKEVLLDNNDAPVYLQVWGGTNTIARALKSIEDEYKNTDQWQAIYDKVSKKTVIYVILDQDATYRNYIAPNWPNIKVLYNSSQFWCLAYDWPKTVPEALKPYLESKWMAANIKDHGPLLQEYMTWGDGHKIQADPDDQYGDLSYMKEKGRGQYDFISEGDSPSYLYLVNVGLRSLENHANGGWSGRLVQSKTNPNRWEDGENVADYNPYTQKLDKSYPQARWIDAIQNDFAARVKWTQADYAHCNHAPVVAVDGSLDITAKAGETVKLNGQASDPDGDKLQYKWWQYREAGSYAGEVQVGHANKKHAAVKIPQDAKKGDTIHMILAVKDSGTPPLTRYAHVVITVK
ncbi:Hypothetical protein LUCI_4986 [Lucifera butyrica]|uniref:DUF1593 domain-containing protein n=1 Tax=Lucifera butyrica TaxID=1351585 RepID=A0A498RKV0_9FIRM|nr:DUF1593 domain-containing protein [Lucifera butyrica]VBB09688.1 Hypothetical protein LUCI_4986 [Lucifera butyrica]